MSGSVASLITCIVLVAALTAGAQKRIDDLRPAHATALKAFLTTNSKFKFLPETAMDAEYLKGMRRGARNMTPYYSIGDFNRDGILDFAVLVSRAGKVRDNGAGMAETHRYDQPLAVVIFNGNRAGKYVRAAVEEVEAPFVSYLKTETKARRARLYFGVFETDNVVSFVPSRTGYIVRSVETH